MDLRLIGDWAACHAAITALIEGGEPVAIGRLGGSDTDAVAARLHGDLLWPPRGDEAALSHLPMVRRYNGYYDKSGDPRKYLDYLDLLAESYAACRHTVLVGAKLLTMYFPDFLHPSFRVADIPDREGLEMLAGLPASDNFPGWAYPYSFYETLTGPHNLLRVLERTLAGKRVLAVTPFADSIRTNWPNRGRFFKSYRYPEYEPVTLQTPITYDGLPAEFYPHDDWFQTLDELIRQTSALEFDIALLSCGSYAMPLANHIALNMGRSAVYVGGILQLFFGIMGRRYQNEFFLNALNPEAFIAPVERERYFRHISLAGDAPLEAFGAYF